MNRAFTCARSLAAVILAAGAAAPAVAQRDFANVEIKATPVAGNVQMLEGSGGNIGVSTGPDGVLMVDSQFAPLADKISAAIAKIDAGPIRFLINTHWHGDHTGGNAHFGKKGSVVAHDNVRKRLVAQPGTAPEALPVITVADGASVHFNGEEIRLIHLGPGHTDGDVIVHFTKSGVYHLGDQFVNARFPFVDQGSGGNVQGLVKNIEAILEKIPEGAKIIPGHGALASRSDLVAYRDMLRETLALVTKAHADGKSLADVKATGLPEKYKSWGAGFISQSRWLEVAYNSVSTK